MKTTTGYDKFWKVISRELGVVTAAVYGEVYGYARMTKGVCQASETTIASNIGITEKTVREAVKRLVKAGYVIDKTPGLRNHPHTLVYTGLLATKDAAFGELENRDYEDCSVNDAETTTVNDAETTTVNATDEVLIVPRVRRSRGSRGYSSQKDNALFVDMLGIPADETEDISDKPTVQTAEEVKPIQPIPKVTTEKVTKSMNVWGMPEEMHERGVEMYTKDGLENILRKQARTA